MIIPTEISLRQRKEFKKRFAVGESLVSIIESVASLDDLHSFLASRLLFKAEKNERLALMKRIEQKFANPEVTKILEFLQYAFDLAEEHLSDAKRHAARLSAEDLVIYVENIVARIDCDSTAPDGVKYPKKIIDSMRSHIVSNIGGLLDFIQRQKISFAGRPTQRNRQYAARSFKSLSNFHSVFSSIIEVLHGHYIPLNVSAGDAAGLVRSPPVAEDKKFLYLLARNPPEWSRLEMCRDLNYGFIGSRPNDEDKLMKASIASGFHRYDEKNSFLRVDFAKSENFEVELAFQTVTAVLKDIYGSTECLFSIGNKKYQIDQLILIAKRIALLKVSIFGKNLRKRYNDRIVSLGYGSLMKALGVTVDLELLVHLFVFDTVATHQPVSAQFLPVFRNDKVFYLMPSLMDSMCYEKILDKILSRKDITIETVDKGYAFEATIADLLANAGYIFGAIKRDESSDVPEIDGIIFLGDETIVVYEAKCSVKPETRDDALTFIENHLEKAIRQLTERITFVRSRPEEVESRVGFNVKNKTIIPLVIANHSYFTGLRAAAGDERAFVIDIELFKGIFIHKAAPTWEYSQETGRYFRKELSIRSTSQVIAILSDLPGLLRSASPATVVVNDFGIGYEISSPPQIDFLACHGSAERQELEKAV